MEAIQVDTTLIMEQYNFNAPINVKIIYDDDEETSEELTQNKNSQCEIRQCANTPYNNVESNLGGQAQSPTFNETNSTINNDKLNVVIDNMAAIIGARSKFEQVCKTLSTAEIQRFKVKYIEMKYLLFKRSIIVAKLLLLPQKNNEMFTRNIVVKILQKAKVNNNLYSIVKLLYVDLLAWTESQIDNEEKHVGAPKNQGLTSTVSYYTAPHLNSGHRKRKHSSNDVQALREMLRKKNCEIDVQSTERNIYPASASYPPISTVYYPTNLTEYCNPQENNINQINGLNPPISMQEQQNHLSTSSYGANSTIEYQNTTQTNISQSLVSNSLNLERNRYDVQDVSRSSISRDSGFMSPDIIFSPQESTNTNYQDPSYWQTPTSTQNTPKANILSDRRLSKVKIDPMYVRGLCNDLILWTEGMKDKILAQSKVDNVSNKFDEKQYVSNNLKRKYNQDNVAKENKVAIFSAGQKGSEIILSVDAQYLNVEHNSQRDNSNKRTREISKVEQNVPYTSVITTPSSELDNTLQNDTHSNSHKHFVKENRSLNNINFSNNNNLENSFNKSIPRSCATNNANDLIKNINYSNQNNVISKIKRRIAHNLRNQEQNTMSGVVKQESNSCSLSNQTVLDRKNSAFYPQTLETGERASYQSIPNAVTHNNTVSQNQMHRPNQNTLDYMANYPTSMPLQYNTTNNVNLKEQT
ncbi:hypothetical protein RR46_04533 [Papilio xuthus]|uniref:Uncharacterized protein n=1 Tax=Papilio xuthus TaxID=66420 RepID=A0A194PTK2_PAPXU|nr:hypothetical protein RR46_04533 [Papilio xuthus]